MAAAPPVEFWSFRFGDIISVLGFIGGGLAGAFLLGKNVDRVVNRVDSLEAGLSSTNDKIDRQSVEIGRLGEVIVLIGRFEERFLGLRREIDDLKRGRGYIVAEETHQGSNG